MKKPIHTIVILFVVWVLLACNLPQSASESTAEAEGIQNLSPEDQLTATFIAKVIELASATPAPEQASLSAQPAVISAENAANLQESGQTPLSNPFGLNWSLDSSRIGAVTQEGLLMFDAGTLAVTANVVVEQPVSLLRFSSETLLMATTADQLTLDLRDINTGSVVHSIQPGEAFSAAIFSPDGKYLAIPLVDQIAVLLYDVATGEQVETYAGFITAAPVYGISFSSDGKYLIWVSRASVQVMALENGQFGEMHEYEDFVGGVALSPDGKTLAVAAASTEGDQLQPIIQLSDAISGEEIARIPSGEFISSSIDFSPDGRLVFAGRNNSVVVWDVTSQQELKSLEGHTDRVNSVSISPDGMVLASSSADGTLRTWRVP